jgi:hypothetical protein
MPRIATHTRQPRRCHVLLSAAKSLRRARGLLEELVLTTVTLWGLWHVVKVLFRQQWHPIRRQCRYDDADNSGRTVDLCPSQELWRSFHYHRHRPTRRRFHHSIPRNLRDTTGCQPKCYYIACHDEYLLQHSVGSLHRNGNQLADYSTYRLNPIARIKQSD